MKKQLQLALPLAALLATSLAATAADEPKPGWHGSFGAGLSMNSGNSDARSFNLGFDLNHDPDKKNGGPSCLHITRLKSGQLVAYWESGSEETKQLFS